jgi:hypothetical protein
MNRGRDEQDLRRLFLRRDRKGAVHKRIRVRRGPPRALQVDDRLGADGSARRVEDCGRQNNLAAMICDVLFERQSCLLGPHSLGVDGAAK